MKNYPKKVEREWEVEASISTLKTVLPLDKKIKKVLKNT